jgi:aromatic ring-opening dioxygenase LigB subunit
MIFKQFKDGSCDIEFSLKERFTLFTKGKLHLSQEGLRHFGNNLVKIVSEWNANFNEEIKNKITFEDTEIK